MAIYRLSEITAPAQAVFHVEAGDPHQARRLVKLHCDVPADDPERYTCEPEPGASVPYGVIYSLTTNTTTTITKR